MSHFYLFFKFGLLVNKNISKEKNKMSKRTKWSKEQYLKIWAKNSFGKTSALARVICLWVFPQSLGKYRVISA